MTLPKPPESGSVDVVFDDADRESDAKRQRIDGTHVVVAVAALVTLAAFAFLGLAAWAAWKSP